MTNNVMPSDVVPSVLDLFCTKLIIGKIRTFLSRKIKDKKIFDLDDKLTNFLVSTMN